MRLFEVDDIEAENCLLTYRAKLKTENLDGKAYLEMWVRAPSRGEFFSKDREHAVSGTTLWASYETPLFLKNGERIDLVKLNLVIEGQGTVWIKEIELLKSPLPLTPGPSPTRSGEKHERAAETQLDPEQMQAAVEAAQEWLRLVDNGQYARAWELSTEYSRNIK